MSEKKIATPEIARATWEEMIDPSVRRVETKLKAAGYVTPSYRTINKWQQEAEAAGQPWKTKKSAASAKDKLKRVRKALDDATPALTGDPRTVAEDVVNAAFKALPPPDAAAPGDQEPELDPETKASLERLKAIREAIEGDPTDEALLSMAAKQTLKTAIIIEAVLGEVAPTLIFTMPEAVGKLQLAVAESLAAAGEPYDRIGRARELAMKTINAGGGAAEIIVPGAADPLSDALAAFKRNAA